MKDYSIAKKLKQYRKKNKLSVKEVSAYLNKYGYQIKPRSIYGYEDGSSMPNADVFIYLCLLYGCTDILYEFGYAQKSVLLNHKEYHINDEEYHILEKYKTLPENGKDMIRGALGISSDTLNQKKEIS